MVPNTLVVIFFSLSSLCLAGDIILDSNKDACRVYLSCATCITKKTCTWCVTKSRCTQQACGNDNVIYPSDVPALMSGPDFCPRVDESKPVTIKSGAKEILAVKITQIYLYMAFTPWKCKITLKGKEKIVPAVLIGDKVYCEVMEFTNDTEDPSIEGSVAVLWDYNKSFDGSLPFKICRCDLDPACKACKL
ncbi:uncharacterized protein LOC123708995 [Pieris brassicae]|uniref:Plexin TIG domain-containing protein n=1 Tax=Pieris brassicae TaxID=7116 RepID=A0A9P0XGM0_PIEBR|nr:uncharacterized protein LOC123708995 [Pieris brassicae]CAH4035549.1 unnamed protein product [Pieris brassicae]